MTDQELMRIALKSAQITGEQGEVPVGAIIVKDGQIVGSGANEREKKLDISSHAEIEAIRAAEKALGRWTLEGCTLYVTLEPCLMCAGAIAQARLDRLVYGAPDPKEGAVESHFYVFADPTLKHRPLVTGGILAADCERLLKKFFAVKR
jgi:Cytosine/adenosine deaminases